MRRLLFFTAMAWCSACHPVPSTLVAGGSAGTTSVEVTSNVNVPPVAGGCRQSAAAVTYDGDVFTATICPNVTAPSVTDAVFVGATVGWSDGRRRDLAAVDVPLAERGMPVTLKERVGPGVSTARVIVWGAKLYVATAPDDAKDDGAERFGYTLDVPLGLDAGDAFPDGIQLDPLPTAGP